MYFLSLHSTANYIVFFCLSDWTEYTDLWEQIFTFSNDYCFPSRWWRNMWLSAIVCLTVFLIVLGGKIHQDLDTLNLLYGYGVREKSLSLPTWVGEVLVRKMKTSVYFRKWIHLVILFRCQKKIVVFAWGLANSPLCFFCVCCCHTLTQRPLQSLKQLRTFFHQLCTPMNKPGLPKQLQPAFVWLFKQSSRSKGWEWNQKHLFAKHHKTLKTTFLSHPNRNVEWIW